MLRADIATTAFDDDYYIYYNNQSVVPKYPNDMNRVFIMYDDFNRADGDVVGNGWVEVVQDTDILNGATDSQATTSEIDKNLTIGTLTDFTAWEFYTSTYQNDVDGFNAYYFRNVSSQIYSSFTDAWDKAHDIFNDGIEGHLLSVTVGKGTGGFLSETVIKKHDWNHIRGQWIHERVIHYDTNGDYGLWINSTDSFIKNNYISWNVTNITDTSTGSTKIGRASCRERV